MDLSSWKCYNSTQTKLAFSLVKGGIFNHQVAVVNGEKTGGDPDLSKFFLERFHQLARQNGRVAVLMPAGIYALDGATALRQMLLLQSAIEAIYSFENAFERFFPNVDSRYKVPHIGL